MRNNDYDSFFNDEPDRYVRVQKRRTYARDIAAQLERQGEILTPAVAHGKNIANQFWGRAWCHAIDEWQDCAYRLPGGRSLLKNGGVIDLKISRNSVIARVAADQVYDVQLHYRDADPYSVAELRSQCAGKLTGLLDFIQGKLSEEVMQYICNPVYGLFPEYGDFKISCTCLDDAVLCRHAAAALYAVATRLDDEPELFFTLRGIDAKDFFEAEDILTQTGSNSAEGLSADELSKTFGIDIEL